MQQTEPQRIHVLPSEVVDQIAAGEVVERPAHMVKELVENALDAGASSVEVEFDQGGRRVRVTDNGRGIDGADLSLALARHATSKIDKAADLWELHSFGFRGEALASIAAVSRLRMQSRPKGTPIANVILSEFGKLSKPEPSSGNPGTTVLIEELFSNVPARLKFLKSEAGESAQIKNTLRALALANEAVEIKIRTKGKLEQVWPATDGFIPRAKQILEAKELFEARGEYQGFKAHLVFASPHEVTGNSRSMQFFVQKRWVQDRSLQAAVMDAYRGLLMHGEFPIVVARLEVPTNDVDVNIHPTKSQVKFRDPQLAFRAINRTLREALERAPWQQASAPGKAAVAKAVESYASESVRKVSVSELTRPYVASSGTSRSEATKVDENAPVESLAVSPEGSVGRFEAPEFQSVQFRQKSALSPQPEEPVATLRAPVNHERAYWSRLQVLGQANLTYIVTQAADRIVYVDQHAAHERVAYERLMRAWKGGEVESQALLLPLTVELEPDGAEALMGIQHELEPLGLLIDQVGPQAVAVRAKPAIIGDGALVKSLQDLAREIVERGGSFALEKKIGDLCATMACHSVVRAGQALSFEQMKSLLAQMDEFPLSSFCPHGRPVSVEYPFARLERDFGRIT